MPARRHFEDLAQPSAQGFSSTLKGTVSSTPMLWLLAALALGAQADEADLPSLEFLEYLGTLVEADGEWVGPEDLDEDALFQRVAGTSDTTPGSREEEVIE